MTMQKYLEGAFGVGPDVCELVESCERELAEVFRQTDERAALNQYRVLDTFRRNEVADRHFVGTTGYGYGDDGREKLNRVFADVFGAEAAIVSPHFMSGTHTIATALFGLLRPGDDVLCVTGRPYDTLRSVIADHSGSLEEFGVHFRTVSLKNGHMDDGAILDALHTLEKPPRMIYLQRSTGYDQRAAFTPEEMGRIIRALRAHVPESVFFVDNCYGEFVDTIEPTAVGADIIAGSLIKNAGGGVSPTGGYIAGKGNLLDVIGARYSAPGVGTEIGSYTGGYRLMFQGLYLAPHVVGQALRGVVLASAVFGRLGYPVTPGPFDARGDITQVIEIGNPDQLVSFVQAIQKASPVDAHVVPMPWNMPGYEDPVIMAAGTFVQGASLELTADAPVRPPFSAYLQGGLTYSHAKLGVLLAAQELMHTS